MSTIMSDIPTEEKFAKSAAGISLSVVFMTQQKLHFRMKSFFFSKQVNNEPRDRFR